MTLPYSFGGWVQAPKAKVWTDLLIKVLPHLVLSLASDSETGEDDASSTQVTQRSQLQDETTYSSPTGEEKKAGEWRGLASTLSRMGMELYFKPKMLLLAPQQSCPQIPS